jgi:hypothetical protein
MDHSAALRKTLSFNQHCTGSKDGYGSEANTQLPGKNLNCQSNDGFDTEENFVNSIKDVNSSIVSIDFNRPKNYPNQS